MKLSNIQRDDRIRAATSTLITLVLVGAFTLGTMMALFTDSNEHPCHREDTEMYVGKIRREGKKTWRTVEGEFNGPEAALARAVSEMQPDDREAVACYQGGRFEPARIVMRAKRESGS